jgi:hypothetical protein
MTWYFKGYTIKQLEALKQQVAILQNSLKLKEDQCSELRQPIKLAFEWEDTENKAEIHINKDVKLRVMETSSSGIFLALDVKVANQQGRGVIILERYLGTVAKAKQAAEEWLTNLFEECFEKL